MSALPFTNPCFPTVLVPVRVVAECASDVSKWSVSHFQGQHSYLVRQGRIAEAQALAAAHVGGEGMGSPTPLHLLETLFQAVDGNAEICVDHFEACDAETLAIGGGPLHLNLTGVLIDFDRDAVLNEDIADATVALSLTVDEAMEVITALTRGVEKARQLAPAQPEMTIEEFLQREG